MLNKELSKEDFDAIQQPLDKDGWSNDYFDKLYGKDKDPYIGDERDRANRKGTKMVSFGGISQKAWDRIFNLKKEI